MDLALIIFARNPVLGKVKTRLAKTMGDETALDIYKQLLKHTLNITSGLEADKYVYYDEPKERHLPFSWSDTDTRFNIKPQSGNNLGERMKNAFADMFNSGYNEVCVIGSDCFDLSRAIIEQAFNGLKGSDIVIGPAHDGGYYLLGMRRLNAPLFCNKQWGSENVLNETIRNIEELHLSLYKLPVLADIDTEQDWLNHRRLLKQ